MRLDIDLNDRLNELQADRTGHQFGHQAGHVLSARSAGEMTAYLREPNTAPSSVTSAPGAAPPAKAATTPTASALRRDISGALDGVGSAVPIALCGVALVYINFPAAYLSYGVLATLLALAAMQFVSAAGARPMVFSARLFEATTLSAMLGQFVKYMPAWGLAPSPQVLLALMCVVGAIAATVTALLFLLRADRFTRMIPAPVYAGFSISISLLLLISQSQQLWRLSGTGHSVAMLISVCAVAIASNVAVRRFRPRWPAAAIGLVAAAAVAVVWLLAGAKVTMVMEPGQALA